VKKQLQPQIREQALLGVPSDIGYYCSRGCQKARWKAHKAERLQARPSQAEAVV